MFLQVSNFPVDNINDELHEVSKFGKLGGKFIAETLSGAFRQVEEDIIL